MEIDTETSSFETSEVLADFLSSTPLLSESWRICSLSYTTVSSPSSGSFVVDEVEGVGYVGFSAVQSVAGLNLNENQLVEIVAGGVFSCLKGEDVERPMVHAGFLHLFLSVYNNGDFQSKMSGLVEKCKAIVFTGHSIGGAIASLAALWLMSQSPIHSTICISFGSPLLGNASLAKSILREKWGGNFFNLVSKHDIVPRLLFAPLTLVSAQLNGLLQLWLLSMTSPQCSYLASHLSENEEMHALHRFILAAKTTKQYELMNSPYTPFGSFILCSSQGAICIDDTIGVQKMLKLMFVNSSVKSSIDDHFSYAETVTQLSQQFLKRNGFGQGLDISDICYEVGISSAMVASGLRTQIHIDPVAQQARDCLKEARQLGCKPNLNSAKLAIQLGKVTPYRAQIEWYKACCDDSDDRLGYYDSFKLIGASVKNTKVNMNRIKLGQFWDKVVDMVEKNELPHDFHKRAKWIYASLFYKLLVEPLDIAYYYRSGMHRTKGHYLEHGRPRRYEVFDKWWEARDWANGEENYKRSKYAGLTQDSCFWARLEEANEWVKNARTQSDPQQLGQLWQKIGQFELYATRLVDSKQVSKDVVASNSSYHRWVEELKELKEQFKQMPPRFSGFIGGEIVP